MSKFSVTLALGLTAIMIAGLPTRADVILTTADIQADIPANSGTVSAQSGVATIKLPANSGFAYTNSYINAGQDAGIPIVVPTGGAVPIGLHTIAADTIQSYQDQVGGTLLSPIHYGGGDIAAVTALGGYVFNVGAGGAAALFTYGTLNLYQIAANSFKGDDPSTWGVSPGNLIASFTLKPQENILGGLPSDLGKIIPASQVNISTASPNPGTSTLGNFLFRQVDGGLSTGGPNSEFVNVNGFDPEILFAQINQSRNTGQEGKVTLSDFNQLNSIAGQLGLANLGGADTAFGTGFNTGVTSDTAYSPGDNPGNPSETAILDIVTNFNDVPNGSSEGLFPRLNQVRPGYEVESVVPEPSSLVLAGAACFTLGAFACLRRRIGTKSKPR